MFVERVCHDNGHLLLWSLETIPEFECTFVAAQVFFFNWVKMSGAYKSSVPRCSGRSTDDDDDDYILGSSSPTSCQFRGHGRLTRPRGA